MTGHTPALTRRTFLMLAAGAAAAACAPGGRPTDADAAIERAVDALAERALAERRCPGLSVAVSRRNRLVLAKGYGLANVERARPAAADTIYQIGSISKQFTAAAVMRLVEQSRLQLDQPIHTWLPDYPAHGHAVLLRHLLHQTSGIREYFTIDGFEAMDSSAPDAYSRADLIALFSKEPLVFAPGERWAYSNSNYTLLGLIIERVSGRSYDAFLQQTLFDPLGLADTHGCNSRPSDGRFATGYVPVAGGWSPARPTNMNMAIGDGGLCSTAVDLVRWTNALAAGTAVSAASYRQMTSSTPVGRGYTPDYGFGLSLVPLAGRRRIGHNGDITGFTGAVARYPDDDVSVAVLVNRARFWPETLEKAVARSVLGVQPPAFADLPLTATDLRAYAGTYDFGVYPLRVTERDGRLFFDMGMGRPVYRLAYQGAHTFVAQDDPDAIRLTFALTGDQADNMLIQMAAMHWYADRVG